MGSGDRGETRTVIKRKKQEFDLEEEPGVWDLRCVQAPVRV